MRRLFVAIPVDPALPLVQLMRQGEAIPGMGRLRWADPGRMHITLKFLGEVPEDQIPEVIRHLKPVVSGITEISFTLQGLGVFGSRYQPKVLWACTRHDEALRALGESVLEAAAAAGFPRERLPFVPHLTLVRIAELNSRQRFQEFVRQHRDEYFQEVKVSRIVLFESRLHTTGAEHLPLETFHFQPPEQHLHETATTP